MSDLNEEVSAEGITYQVENPDDLDPDLVWRALDEAKGEFASLEDWLYTTSGGFSTTNYGGIDSWGTSGVGGGSTYNADLQQRADFFNRNEYRAPRNILDEFRLSYDLMVRDDVVSTVCDLTEGLAIDRIKWEVESIEEEDIWDQIAQTINLEIRIREMWRELFGMSQFYVAMFWGKKNFKVRGKTKNEVKRRKQFSLQVPLSLSLLDPTKVVPVGNLMFGKERLAWIASQGEIDGYGAGDVVLRQLWEKKYTVTQEEKTLFGKMGIDTELLYLMREENVWRHTLTRPAYKRWADIRMKSVFPLADMKANLRQMDRAHLVGAALRVDQRIATPEGWKRIDALRIGDEVFGPTGSAVKVIGSFPQGERPLYKLTTSDGAEVICDENHLWTVQTFGDIRRKKNRTITTGQIIGNGLRTPQGTHRFFLPVSLPLDLPAKEFVIDPYLMGYLLGDGGMTQLTPRITSAEKGDYPWADVLPKNHEAVQYADDSPFRAASFGLRGKGWRQNEITASLREFGLMGRNGHHKFIPEEYLWGSTGQRISLLQGLLDSDGNIVKTSGAEFNSTSEKLVDGVIQLVQSLGGYATKKVRKPTGLGKATTYRTHITLPPGITPFRLRRKVEEYKPRHTRLVRAITRIERVDSAQALCIKVDSPDGLYVTEGMIVTHNTNFILVVRKGTDKLPARQQEIDNLEKNVRKLARVPLLIGDHRLSVEIITPPQDYTLDDKKWDTIDKRISARLMTIFTLGDDTGSRDTAVTLGRAIARGIESRRSALGRSLEANIVQKIMDKNPGILDEFPHFAFSPKHVALDWDPAFVTMLLQLRDRGDLSRETILEEVNYTQSVEARRREYEEEFYDDIFKTATPYDSPQNNSTPGGKTAPAKKTAPQKSAGGADNKTGKKPPGRPASPKLKTASPSAKVTIHVKGDASEAEGSDEV